MNNVALLFIFFVNPPGAPYNLKLKDSELNGDFMPIAYMSYDYPWTIYKFEPQQSTPYSIFTSKATDIMRMIIFDIIIKWEKAMCIKKKSYTNLISIPGKWYL